MTQELSIHHAMETFMNQNIAKPIGPEEPTRLNIERLIRIITTMAPDQLTIAKKMIDTLLKQHKANGKKPRGGQTKWATSRCIQMLTELATFGYRAVSQRQNALQLVATLHKVDVDELRERLKSVR